MEKKGKQVCFPSMCRGSGSQAFPLTHVLTSVLENQEKWGAVPVGTPAQKEEIILALGLRRSGLVPSLLGAGLEG